METGHAQAITILVCYLSFMAGFVFHGLFMSRRLKKNIEIAVDKKADFFADILMSFCFNYNANVGLHLISSARWEMQAVIDGRHYVAYGETEEQTIARMIENIERKLSESRTT